MLTTTQLAWPHAAQQPRGTRPYPTVAHLVLVELLEAQPRAALPHAALRGAHQRRRQLAHHLPHAMLVC